MEFKYIPVTQKGLTYFISVTDALGIVDKINVNRRTSRRNEPIVYDLLKLEENIREINEKKIGQGLQRELMPDKVKEITKYLNGDLGLIPNSIIINISDPLGIVEFTNDLIYVPDDESIVLTALDGQHRLEGIKAYINSHKSEKYEIPLTIFYNSQLAIVRSKLSYLSDLQ